MGSHTCPAVGCDKRVADVMLMCRTHWSQVPAPLQQEVYRAWDRCRGAGTDRHRHAMQAAIESLPAEVGRASDVPAG